ncbi:MAG: tRNA lysidine(34) synthetase TilS [Erysipelothrix sp.]
MDNEIWIVGVSGGPDSMALLDIYSKQGKKCIAAHVNYHQRETSQRDEDIVVAFCKKHKIEIRVKNFEQEVLGRNFQALARDFRYEFFEELVMQYGAQGVAIAHHLDDDLETYVFQKQRGISSDTKGIANQTIIKNILVVRPLLDYTKQELIDYCHDNNVAYGVDESNASLKYARNKIRHELKQMDPKEKEILLESMRQDKKDFATYQYQVREATNEMELVNSLVDYKKHSPLLRKDVLRKWMSDNGIETHKISARFIDQIDSAILSEKAWFEFGNLILSCSYGELAISKRNIVKDTYNSLAYLKTEYYGFKKEGRKIEGVFLTESDFPITVRNVRDGDQIEMRFGKKSLNRFFIDRKIPSRKRINWLVIENQKGNVVFVVGLGCDTHHYSNNMNLFMIEL